MVNTPLLVSHVTVEADAEHNSRVLPRSMPSILIEMKSTTTTGGGATTNRSKKARKASSTPQDLGEKMWVVVEVIARDQDAAAAPVRSAPSALGIHRR